MKVKMPWFAAIAGLLTTVFAIHAVNLPPSVGILWPEAGDGFRISQWIKIKTWTIDQDGSVRRVRFYADEALIGTVAEPPFDLVWEVSPRDLYGAVQLKAIAEDNEGAEAQAGPLRIWTFSGAPPYPTVKISSPRHGEVFPAGTAIPVTVEVLASLGDAGPVDLYAGTNLVASFQNPDPFFERAPINQTTVTNLGIGLHQLRVNYRGNNGSGCICEQIEVRVAELGLNLLTVSPGQASFEAVTAFPEKAVTMQWSSNLTDWLHLTSVRPMTNRFLFTNSFENREKARWYRAVIPWE